MKDAVKAGEKTLEALKAYASVAPRRWYTTGEVAAELGVSRSAVYDWIKEGKIQASYPVGTHARVHSSELERLKREAGVGRSCGAGSR